MPNDYLFTWKVDKWPYPKLRALIDDFDAGLEVTEAWRCAAHRQVKKGDVAYLFKQGDAPRGIFAVGTVSGPVVENEEASTGENRWQVPITFRAFVDPTQKLLVPEEKLLAMPAPEHRWRAHGSGIRLEPTVARAIDIEIAVALAHSLLRPDAAIDDDFSIDDIVDARERVNRSIVLRRGQRAFREKLFVAYDRRCAVTGCNVEDLLEAAHIVPYKGDDTDHIQNGLLLRSDIHTLFDCGLIAIDAASMKVLIGRQLRDSGYRRLAGRPLRIPTRADQKPSTAALSAHRRATGL
jgi:putative restriction endonuclease